MDNVFSLNESQYSKSNFLQIVNVTFNKSLNHVWNFPTS